MTESRNVFLFVIWSAARAHEERIVGEIVGKFRILRDFEVSWPKRHFTANLAAFYGWRSWHVWRNKARKCGTGPFRVIVVEDPSPVWVRERDMSGHELTVDMNVYALKKSFRALTGHSNLVHSSVTPEETTHQLAALDAPSDSPLPFHPMVYADDARVRAARRSQLLALSAEFLLAVVLAVAAAIFFKPVIRGPTTEKTTAEWVFWAVVALEFADALVCAVLARREKAVRGAAVFLSAVFLCDVMELLQAQWWNLAVVCLVAALVVARYRKSVLPGFFRLHRAVRAPVFPLAVGVAVFDGLFAPWVGTGVVVAHAVAFALAAVAAIRLMCRRT